MEVHKKLETLEGAKDFFSKLTEECRKNLIEAIACDAKLVEEKKILALQKEILQRVDRNWPRYQWERFRTITDKLVAEKDEEMLRMLNEKVDFTKSGWLIFFTPEGPVKMAPRQATYEEIKDIPGIEIGKNVRTKNENSWQKWLRVNFEAVEKIEAMGKRICSEKEYMNMINIFPRGNEIWENIKSPKVKDFLELLWVDQVWCYTKENDRWVDSFDGMYLWIGKKCGKKCGIRCGIRCHSEEGCIDEHCKDDGLGIWFIEE